MRLALDPRARAGAHRASGRSRAPPSRALRTPRSPLHVHATAPPQGCSPPRQARGRRAARSPAAPRRSHRAWRPDPRGPRLPQCVSFMRVCNAQSTSQGGPIGSAILHYRAQHGCRSAYRAAADAGSHHGSSSRRRPSSTSHPRRSARDPARGGAQTRGVTARHTAPARAPCHVSHLACARRAQPRKIRGHPHLHSMSCDHAAALAGLHPRPAPHGARARARVPLQQWRTRAGGMSPVVPRGSPAAAPQQPPRARPACTVGCHNR